MQIGYIFITFFLVFVILYLYSYICFIKFTKKEKFIREIFPSKKSEYDIYEFFEVQTFFYAFFIQYHLRYKKNGSLPLVESNILLDHLNKTELISFFEINYKFIKSNFIIFILGIFFFLLSFVYMFF